MKLNIPRTESLLYLQELFKEKGYEIRIAGGAVRDLLLSKTPEDVDFATTATPDQMKQMFKEAGLKILNRKGEAHGTVAVRVKEEEFEVTTLRIDVATDGRHAKVTFTTDWEQDARRRDLTINAMFLGLDGSLYDYFNGAEDLKNHQIRFVGDPETRIKEDYLRILRYFRFHARFCKEPTDHDPQLLSIIQEHCHGLSQISSEKRQLELFKILKGQHVYVVMATMIGLGIAPHIGLPEKPNLTEFKAVCDSSLNLNPYPATLLASLVDTEEQAGQVALQLRLTNAARDLILYIVLHRTETERDLLACQKEILMSQLPLQQQTRDFVCQLLKYQGHGPLLEQLEAWQIPKFPLTGFHLKQLGFKPGPHIANILSQLKEQWIDSNFQLQIQDMLETATKLLEKS